MNLFTRGNPFNDDSHFLGNQLIEEKGYELLALSKEEKVHEVFEKISTDYDKMNSVISFNQHKKWRDDIMRRWQCNRCTCA